MADHNVKIDQDQFELILQGKKKFDMRFNDRNYQEGDVIHHHETRYSAAEMKDQGQPLLFTGRVMNSLIIHIMKGPLPEAWGHCSMDLNGWVIMSLAGSFMTIDKEKNP